MKRNALLILIAGLTFTAGVIVTTTWHGFSNRSNFRNHRSQNTVPTTSAEPEIPFVALCELLRNPEAYDRKIVRTKAILYWGVDGLDMWSTECDRRGSYIAGDCFSSSINTCGSIKESIEKSHGGKEGSWVLSETAIDVVGQFCSYGDGGTRHSFYMLEIKDAKAVSGGL